MKKRKLERLLRSREETIDEITWLDEICEQRQAALLDADLEIDGLKFEIANLLEESRTLAAKLAGVTVERDRLARNENNKLDGLRSLVLGYVTPPASGSWATTFCSVTMDIESLGKCFIVPVGQMDDLRNKVKTFRT